jgi:phosphohistidine phosphatase
MVTSSTVVLLVRHGRAEIGQGKADAERQLTAEGLAELSASCAGLVRSGVALDAVVTSPLTRARQTAAVLARDLGHGLEPAIAEELAPGALADAVLAALATIGPGKCIAVVAHAPDLTSVVAALVVPGGPRTVSFAPGSIACVEFEGPPALASGKLRWAHAPADLARLCPA